jgi:hypothetical protein
MRARTRTIASLTVTALALLAICAYVLHQVQRLKMKSTATRIRVLASVLDAQKGRRFETCDEAMKAIKLPPNCLDSWGGEIHLRQEVGTPVRYVIWAQGDEPETSGSVHNESGWRHLPDGMPP